MEVQNKIVGNKWSFTEKDAANLIKQILMALNYMHKQGVLHRDLKMENVMVDIEENDSGSPELICKLTDFGFTVTLEKGEKTRQRLGTPLYMAPEIINGQNYDSRVDTWALGVISYILLSDGKFPFTGRTNALLFNQIRNYIPDLSIFDKYTNSEVLKDFVMCCLDKNPTTRYTAE